VPFSFWPVDGTGRTVNSQGALVVSDPWAVIRAAIKWRCPMAGRSEAAALAAQAEDYYRAGRAAARVNPSFMFGSFWNLTRALVLMNGATSLHESGFDDLAQFTSLPTRPLFNSSIIARASASADLIHDLSGALGLDAPLPEVPIPVADLLGQVVVGHRIYRCATRAAEHFVPVREVQFMTDPNTRAVWVDLLFDGPRLNRHFQVSRERLLRDSGLGVHFREVSDGISANRRFEMTEPVVYRERPAVALRDVVQSVKPYLWASLGNAPPRWTHHVYLASSNRLPQMLSLFLLLFYFTSTIQRRPDIWEQLIADPLGVFIVKFISDQPVQLLFMLASEFAQRQVVPPPGSISKSIDPIPMHAPGNELYSPSGETSHVSRVQP
jgi:hypothetical protein